VFCQARQAEERRKRAQQLCEEGGGAPQDEFASFHLGALPLGLSAVRAAPRMCMRVHDVERDVHGAACEREPEERPPLSPARFGS